MLKKFNTRSYLEYEYGISPEDDLQEIGFSVTYSELERIMEVAYRYYRSSNNIKELNYTDRVDPEGLTDL